MKRAGRKTAFCVLPSERGLGQGASAFAMMEFVHNAAPVGKSLA